MQEGIWIVLLALLDHYTKVFGDTRLMVFILNTFILALLSALLATAIGTLGRLWFII